jgi:hypothetical protein
MLTVKELGKLADNYYKAREKRLAADKIVKDLKDIESGYANELIENLAKDTTGVSGKLVHVYVDSDEVPKIEDRDKFMAFVMKNKAWEFVPASVNKAPCKELWEEGKKIPGITSIFVPKLHYSKL